MSEPITFDLYIDPDKVVMYTEFAPDCDVTVLKNKQDHTFTIYYRSGRERKGLSAFDCANILRSDKAYGDIKVFDGDIDVIRQTAFGRLSTLVAEGGQYWYDPIHMPNEDRFERVINYAFGGKHHVHKYKENSRFAEFNLTTGCGLSTTDFDQLTRLVVASHLYGVRAEIVACNMHFVKVYLHARHKRDGSLYERHPDAIELIEMIVDRAGKVMP